LYSFSTSFNLARINRSTSTGVSLRFFTYPPTARLWPSRFRLIFLARVAWARYRSPSKDPPPQAPYPTPPCVATLKDAAPVRWTAALWHGGRELLRTAHWLAPLRSASGLFPPSPSERVKGRGGKKGSGFNEPNRTALREDTVRSSQVLRALVG
jgi:hypothetical protein